MTEILILIVLCLLGTSVGIAIYLVFQVLNEIEELKDLMEERLP